VVATIELGIPYPYGVACHPDGAKVQVSGTGVASDGTVYLVDVATQTRVDSVAVGKRPSGLAVLRDGSKVFVANSEADTVSVIDTATFTVTGAIPLDVNVEPYGVLAHPDSSTVYVSSYVGSNVSVLDVATGTATNTIPVQAKPKGITIDPDFPAALAIHPDGGTLYVSLQRLSVSVPISGVAVADSVTRSQTQVIPGFWSPHGLSGHPLGDRLYVVDTPADAVEILDTSSDTVVDSVAVGYGPYAFGEYFIRTLLFADGFELGNLTAWSHWIP
jgi:YVTN family beta-propeller protein